MQLLTAVALPADHMTTGNQDHSGAVLVADGAVCPGATIGSVRTPRRFIPGPVSSHLGAMKVLKVAKLVSLQDSFLLESGKGSIFETETQLRKDALSCAINRW